MVGRIVCSKAGRDKDYFLVVVKTDGKYVYVCDGKERPCDRPKRKNIKHLKFTNTVLSQDSFKTNKQLKKAIAVYRDTAKFKEEP